MFHLGNFSTAFAFLRQNLVSYLYLIHTWH